MENLTNAARLVHVTFVIRRDDYPVFFSLRLHSATGERIEVGLPGPAHRLTTHLAKKHVFETETA